ncbi:MAG: alpha-mannosidase [Phycisphaerales bacterium]|nr:alpha-mannosidase [Phycisphaerales bacterium]
MYRETPSSATSSARDLESIVKAAKNPERHVLNVCAYRAPQGKGAHVLPGMKPAQVMKQVFEEVALGMHWGPVWSTVWFRLSGTVPQEWKGCTVALRFSSGTEATLWRDGVPFHGFDPYRDTAVLFSKAQGGEVVDLLIEADCNLPLGATTFWWDQPEVRARWSEETPGRLESAELILLDEDAWRQVEVLEVARKSLLLERAADDAAGAALRGLIDDQTGERGRALQRAARESRAFGGDADASAGRTPPNTAANTAVSPSGPGGQCTAVGHAHIDTAWLWTLECTRRKCLRTFANVLRLMERFDSFRFLCSQAQQYAFVEADSPPLFAQIRARVAEGRWEPGGGMWIEPDCTAPSGESFIRQVLHGERYWREHFGEIVRQDFLYLPDTFGFPASLPQIALLCGLRTFITNKMSWCDTNRFPLVNFMWRGIDGSEIATHFTPGHNYNSSIEPADMRLGQTNLLKQESGFKGAWLQPFGYGDGGGGPTQEQCLRAEVYSAFFDTPPTVQRSVRDFCAELELERAAGNLPVWDGELYLECHRGTYTSQAWIKRANAEAESALRRIELLAVLAPKQTAENEQAWRAQMDTAWKCVLLHQFHDILPGSSIKEVYDDARIAFAGLNTLLEQIETESCARVCAGAAEAQSCCMVLNPSSVSRSGIVDTSSGLIFARDVPGASAIAVPRTRVVQSPSIRLETREMTNGLIHIQVDSLGRLARVSRAGAGDLSDASVLPLNQLMLYEDRPRSWEAWEIDRDYVTHGTAVISPCDMKFEIIDDLLARCTVKRSLGDRSHIEQCYELEAGAPWVRIRTRVEWQEDRRLLRALFPTSIRARRATFGIQFGSIERSTYDNTSWEQAQFEVPGHGWMDLAQPGNGLAVLDDGTKFGRSVKHGVLGLSLLRAPQFPDPTADRGTHSFSYGLMPHGGDWRSGGVADEAECFAQPLRAIGSARAGARAQLFTLRGSASVQVSAVKPAEDGRGVIVRLVERVGARSEAVIDWTGSVRSVEAVDALERPFTEPSQAGVTVTRQAAPVLHHDGATCRTSLTLRPFQIATIRVLP